MKFGNSRPTGTRWRELALRRPAASRWTFSTLALIAAAALSLSALSVAHAAGVADSYTAYVDTVLSVDAANGVLANDGAPDLTATREEDPSHGTLALKPDGAFTYTPAAGYIGPDGFKYIVTGDGGVGHVWVTLDVVDGSPPADDPPSDDPPADDPPADDPPIEEEDEEAGVEPYLEACAGTGHASLIALCSVAIHAPAPAMGVMKNVIMAHADGLILLRGHGRR